MGVGEEMLRHAHEWVDREIEHVDQIIARLRKELADRGEDEGRRYHEQTLYFWQGKADQMQIIKHELLEGVADLVTFQPRDHSL